MVVTWEVNSSRKWRDSNLEISTKHQVQISISELNLKGRWAYCMVFSWKLQVKRILTLFQDTLTNAIVLWNDFLCLQGFPKHLSGLKKLVAYGRMLVRTSKTTYLQGERGWTWGVYGMNVGVVCDDGGNTVGAAHRFLKLIWGCCFPWGDWQYRLTLDVTLDEGRGDEGRPHKNSMMIAASTIKIKWCFSTNLGKQPKPQDLMDGIIPLIEPLYWKGYVRCDGWVASPGEGKQWVDRCVDYGAARA